MSKATAEAERRRRARERKAQTAAPVVMERPYYAWGELPHDDWCPDKENHKVCPKTGGGHGWIKPNPRPDDHKYECEDCGHYDLDDYM